MLDLLGRGRRADLPRPAAGRRRPGPRRLRRRPRRSGPAGRLRRVPAHLRRGAAAPRMGGRRAARPLRDRADPGLRGRRQAGARHLPRRADPQRGLRGHALPGPRPRRCPAPARTATGSSTTPTTTTSTWPPGSRLAGLYGGRRPRWRSTASTTRPSSDLAAGLRGRGPLGRPTASIEAIRRPGPTATWPGVQWHPEFTPLGVDRAGPVRAVGRRLPGRGGRGPVGPGRVVKIVDPATGEAFDTVLDDTPETIAAKVAAARAGPAGLGGAPAGRARRHPGPVPRAGWSTTPTSWPPP